MELNGIDFAIMIAFVAISVGIGLYFSRRAGKSVDNFFLGGRNLPWWLAGISMVATTFAADTPLAVTELVVQDGIAGNWIWWNMLAGGMLTTLFFARYWRRAGVLTDLELIELRYGGPAARFLRAFRSIYFGVFLNCLIIGWVNLALGTLLTIFFGIPEADVIYYLLGAMVVVALYSSLSGLLGVVYTDVLQFVIAMAGCIVLAVLVVNSPEIGGMSALKTKLPEGALSFFPKVGSGPSGDTLALGLGSFLAFMGFQWWASWYPGNEPGGGGYVAQRMMSTKDEKHAIYSTLFFQVGHYALRPWPWILVALCAVVLYPELSLEDADARAGFVMVMRDFLPHGLKGLLMVAFFAAYMSTISTQLNWGTSYLINDLYRRFIKPEASQKHLVRASRLGTVLIMLVALGFTTQMESVSGVWKLLIEAGAGLGLVLILRWYWWRINAWSEIVAMLVPFLALGYVHLFTDWEFPVSFFFILAFTTVSWLLVTFLTPPERADTLRGFYQKIKPDGWWTPVAGHPTFDSGRLGKLLLLWLCGVLLVYSTLFAIGGWVLAEYPQGLMYTGLVAVLLIVFVWLARRVKIFAD